MGSQFELENQFFGFSKVTTSEKKTGFFLIEIFRKLFNTQIEGHLDHLQVTYPICQEVQDPRFYDNLP